MLAVFRSYVGGIHHHQAAGREALFGDVVQNIEGIMGRALIVFVIGDEAPAEVGREDLRRLEVLFCEGRLSASRGSGEDHERQFRNRDVHRVKTPI